MFLLSASKFIGVGIDVAIVGVIVIFALIGLFKGFFKSVISMISTFVVLIASIFLASPVAKLVNKIYDFTGLIAGKLCKNIAGLGSFYSEPIHNMSGAEVAGNIPSGTNGFLKKFMTHTLKPLSAGDIEGATVADIVSGSFASIIMLVISAILVFILIKIVIAIITRLFDNISRNRVFGFSNKLLGFVFGACKGLLAVFVFALTLTALTVIPVVNKKVSPLLQDHTKIAKPIYNFSDRLVEKYVIDGKVIQKWVDGLWENKYKGRGEVEDISPNGTLEKPYMITLAENEGHYTAELNLTFTDKTPTVYYKLNASTISTESYNLQITVDGNGYKVYLSTDTENELIDLSSLDKTKDYIIKFTQVGEQTNVTANVLVTPV